MIEMTAPEQGMKEALFYEATLHGVHCQICPHECVIKEGKMGKCKSRMNMDGKLWSMAYGHPCAVHIDPIEKKPFNHFLPGSKAFSIGTAGCNLSCLNCQNWTISQKSPNETSNMDLPPDKVVDQCIENNIKTIAYTYTEPITFYEYTYDTSVLAHKEGIKNIIISAGYINHEPLVKLSKVIDGANIDLKSFSNAIYQQLNAVKLQPVLNTLLTLKDKGVWLEITNLIVPTWTDDMDTFKQMCAWLAENGFTDTPLHISRFSPLYKLTQVPSTPVNTLLKAAKIALDEGINYVYIGNVLGTDFENTVCPQCKNIVVKRHGCTILDNNIEKGKCKTCGNSIPGVWE